MTMPRRTLPGATYLLTRRCERRRFGLVPRGITPGLVGYAIALAAARHGIEVHAVVALSNHIHGIFTDPRGVISDFARDVHSLIARALNAEYGVWENFWSTDGLSLVRLVGPADVWSKLVYCQTNAVAAGLVERSPAWPGFRTAPADVRGPGLVFPRPRTALFRKTSLPDEVTLRLTVPPALAQLAPDAFAEAFAKRVRSRESELRAQAARDGRPFLGARAVLKQRRDTRPATREPRRGRDPSIACRDKPRRIAELTELKRFREAYFTALQAWRAGHLPVCFPPGTTKMRAYPGVTFDSGPPAERQAA